MNRNPHWLPGETSADHARRRGWTVGTRLISHGDSGSTTITITAIGRESILALPDDNRSECTWTLQCRDWQLETPEQETTTTTDFSIPQTFILGAENMTTETFAASNGHRIVRQHDDRLAIFDPRGTLDRGVRASLTTALREYFQHERDAELGRWRDEESPDYVVYPARAGSITILHEPTGRQRYLTGRGEAKIATGEFADTARRYFAAHPEPKPWHSAEVATLWRITAGALGKTRLAIAHEDVTFTDHDGIGWKADEITHATRIWPTEETDR